MMILFSPYFISADRFSSMKTNMAVLIGKIGAPANAGGTSSYKFAEDGGTSYLHQLVTSVFAFFVHLAHP
jgi:hypothetical protein